MKSVSRAPFYLDVRRQTNVVLHQVSIDLLLTMEDRHLGIKVHRFSRSKVLSLSFLFNTLLAPSLTASNNIFSSRHLQNEDDGFRNRDQKQRRNKEAQNSGKTRVCEKKPSCNSSQFKYDADNITIMALKSAHDA